MKINDIKELVFKKNDITHTSGFGKRTYTVNKRVVTDYHYGWDFAYHKKGKLASTNVYAVNSGTVYRIGKDSVSGNYLYIKYPSLNLLVFYCHLKKINVKVGNKVNSKTIVGVTGNTGNSTGIHLHLGIKYIGSNTWINPANVSLRNYNYVYIASNYLKVINKKALYNVNFRKSPSLNGKVILIIRKNEKIEIIRENDIISDGYNWDRVKFGNNIGYVANEYFLTDKAIAIDKVNVRTGPSTNNLIVTTIKKNTSVDIVIRKYKQNGGLYFDRVKI